MNLKTRAIFPASLFVLMTLMSLPAFAQTVDFKVGYVDTQRIFRTAPEAVKAAQAIETEFSKRDQELQRLAKQLQVLQENAEKNALTMSESDRRNKEREFNELSRDFQRKQREFREDLNLRQNEANAIIIDKANKAIKQIAEGEKFDLILQDAVWVNPRLDITDKVIKALSDIK
jgi:outer membrane protein